MAALGARGVCCPMRCSASRPAPRRTTSVARAAGTRAGDGRRTAGAPATGIRTPRTVRRTATTAHVTEAETMAQPRNGAAPSRSVIVGAGPAGLAAAIMLAKRGWTNIDVFDRLGPLPSPDGDEWGNPYRSYNLGLSGRGQQVLSDLGVMERVDRHAAYALGRMDWSPGKEEPNFRESQKAYAPRIIQRDRLASCLMEEVKTRWAHAVTVHHHVQCCDVELLEGGGARLSLQRTTSDVDPEGAGDGCSTQMASFVETTPFLLGADGVNTAVRDAMSAQPGTKTKVKRFDDNNARVYKILPLTLPEDWRKDVNYSARTASGINLEAMPTKEGGMVGVVLFKPDNTSVISLKTGEQARKLFNADLPMFAPYISEDDFEQFAQRPVSRLPTFSFCGPSLHHDGTVALVGDAIHTVKPYFGMGVNSAFEDVAVLGTCLDEAAEDLPMALQLYTRKRAQEAKALVEMSRHLDHPGFLQFLTFILPLIVDSIFFKLAPLVFAPSLLQLMQNKDLTYTQVRRRKWMDRLMQTAVFAAALCAFVTAFKFLFGQALKVLARFWV